DLAWPNGIQEELSQPVALLLNEGPEVVAVASQAGYRCSLRATDLQRYVQAEIPVEAAAERTLDQADWRLLCRLDRSKTTHGLRGPSVHRPGIRDHFTGSRMRALASPAAAFASCWTFCEPASLSSTKPPSRAYSGRLRRIIFSPLNPSTG